MTAVVDVAGDVAAVRALVDVAVSRQDCEQLAQDVRALAAAELRRVKARTRAVMLLDAAGIHLHRAGVHVTHERGCRLASQALDGALAELAGEA